MNLTAVGTAANVWREAHDPPLSTEVLPIVAKLTEEVGELARAIIGRVEHRDGRGDPLQEAAQVIIVVASLIDAEYGDSVSLEQAIADEMQRLGVRFPQCPLCGGTGQVDCGSYYEPEVCPCECGGR